MLHIPNDIPNYEQNFYIAGYQYCKELIQNGQEQMVAIDQTSDRFSGIVADVNQFRLFLLSEITVYTETGIGIISPEVEDNMWYTDLCADINYNPQYWTRYRNYLRLKPSWSIKAIDNIDDSTNDVMNALANPRLQSESERRGLVFGYVQSGKTAHYIGLINKAYDAGYKIIIVLTGIHNSLRSQTQSRIDEEVLGYETSLDRLGDYDTKNNAIGVGVGEENKTEGIEPLQSITTRDEKGDFCKRTSGVSMAPPFVIVTKKNASVLKRIISYFRRSHIAIEEKHQKYIPAKFPALIIDDEADQASINTNEIYDANGNMIDDLDPTTINGLIRKLLRIFKCRSYVGYTATPFANIFIPPHLDNEHFGEDLYPRDFIFRAPRSDQYIGAREFFGLYDEDGDVFPSMPLFRPIVAGSGYLGRGTTSDAPVGEIPDEMKLAIKYFLISTALRNCRGQRNKPNTMLIHVVRFVAQQNQLKKRVQTYYKSIADLIRYGDSEIKEELNKLWNDDYVSTSSAMTIDFPKYMSGCSEISWDDIWNEIQRIIRKKEIIVYSVNGKSEDSLIYKNHENQPFNVIVIGGDKLSRGLTLEGLTISYFTRSSNTYDTLMQMGRWFGYRPGYIDACRLFTTHRLHAAFTHISMSTEDLAAQFEFMNDMNQTPMDFGLRVATHPTLEITSRNKLRTGLEIKRDFSCKLSQTRTFDIDGAQYDHNFEAVEALLRSIGTPISDEKFQETFHRKKPGHHFFWLNISSHLICEFFTNYETSKTATRANSKYMADYIRTMNQVGGLTDWTVCLMNMEQDGQEKFAIADIKEVGAGIYRKEGAGVQSYDTTCSIHTMTSAGHEYYDYTQEEVRRAEELRMILEQAGEKRKTISEKVRAETREFTKGLLLLYPIANAGKLTANRGEHKVPFGFAVVFPDRKNRGNLQAYRMTEIALEKDSDEFFE